MRMVAHLGSGRIFALALVVVIAVFALAAFKTTQTASAQSGISNLSCTFSPSGPPPPPNTPDSVTCTFDFNGQSHTLTVDFSFPPLDVTACTLDGTAIHVGPCP